MANNFPTKLHIDNHRLSALSGTLVCQPQKGVNFHPKNEGLAWVKIWRPIVKSGTPLISLELRDLESWNFTHI